MVTIVTGFRLSGDRLEVAFRGTTNREYLYGSIARVREDPFDDDVTLCAIRHDRGVRAFAVGFEARESLRAIRVAVPSADPVNANPVVARASEYALDKAMERLRIALIADPE